MYYELLPAWNHVNTDLLAKITEAKGVKNDLPIKVALSVKTVRPKEDKK